MRAGRGILLLFAWAAACGTAGSIASKERAGGESADAAVSPTGDGGVASDASATVSPQPRTFFRDVTGASGVSAIHAPPPQNGIKDDYYLISGIGLAAGDLDGDGRTDLVIPTGIGPTLVYRNGGALRFTDVSAASGVDGHGVASGASLCDLDGDGDLDLLLSTDQLQPDTTVRLFTNRGDGTFVDTTAAAGIAARGSARSVVCSDLDGDGLLDLYVASFSFGFDMSGRPDAFFRNRGDGTFVDDASRSGFDTHGYTWTASAADYDGDGRLDLYVANDTFVEDDGSRPLPSPIPSFDVDEDLLFHNEGPGADGHTVFRDVSATSGAIVREPRSSMGVVSADMTGDGRLDYYVSTFGRKALLVGASDGTFSDQTSTYLLEGTRRYDNGTCAPAGHSDVCLLVSWGSAYEDFDLDGKPDLLVANGQIQPGDAGLQPQLVWRAGEQGRAFAPVQTELPWMNARGLVTADLDGDGDLDVVTATWGGPARVFENVWSNSGHWLGVALRATTSAPEGRGAEVTVAGVKKQIGTGGLAYSSAPAEARFGLGAATSASIDVRWPSGARTHVAAAQVDRVVAVDEPPTVRVSRRVAPADGTSTVEAIVTPGKMGAVVAIDATAGTWQGPVIDAGDGSYHRVLVAPAAPALAALRVTVDGAERTAYPRIDFR